MADNNHDHASFAHPAPVKMLLAVFFSLIFLTILTVVTAGQLPHPFGLYVAFFIATMKAALVMLFFMHMFWDKSFNSIVFMSSFLFALLFVSMTLMDTKAYQNDIDQFPREAEVQAPNP
jgi:cytochrome c oxidase subunit 4